MTEPHRMPVPPIVWSIAGSDSGGGAGIQADIPTIQALGGHAATAVTAVTAQNSVGVQAAEPVPESLFVAQLQSLEDDLPPRSIKIGLLSETWQIARLQERLPRWRQQWPELTVVLDPVMIATSGDSLASDDVVTALHGLLPWVDVLTPNLPELRALTGQPCQDLDSAMTAARTLLTTGCRHVLVKGGHADWDRDTPAGQCVDVLVSTDMAWRFAQPWVNTPHTHGTGCTLSSAIAAALAGDHPPEDAIVVASAYLQRAIQASYPTGQGAGTPKRFIPADVGAEANACPTWRSDPAAPMTTGFLECMWKPLGLYPVVPDTAWLQRLLKMGVKTLQLRAKDPASPQLRDEIRSAIQLGQQYGAQVFINDHWELAIELGAYGVHLGQEDLAIADLAAIQAAGLRLGISTHGYAELLRALAMKPSYVALGHVFPTETKDMPSKPQGLTRLARYQAMADNAGVPTVAIGGIKPDHLPDIRACGVTSVAMVTAITHADDPAAVVKHLQEALQ